MLNSVILDMQVQSAAPDFIAALESLLNDEVAAKAVEFLGCSV